jgi:hypothetical protein
MAKKSYRRTASVTLTAYNLGPNTREADFDAWVAYVAEHIDEATGLDVSVDAFAFTGRGAGGDKDNVSCDDEDRETIEEALEMLWERGCAESFKEDREGSRRK